MLRGPANRSSFPLVEPTVIQLKSLREMQLMRRAGLVVWKALQEAEKVVRPGVTTSEIDMVIERVFDAHGAKSLFKGVAGDVPFPASTCISVNEQVVHGIPNRRKLREGDIVSIDTGCRLNGWCGDSAWTYPVGRIGAPLQKLLDVTKGSLDLAIDLVGKKQRWSEVAREIQNYVHAHGCSVVENYCGHGLGRELHEEPQYPNYVSDKLLEDDVVLRTGLVFAIEPMINLGKKETRVLGDKWTVSASDGRPSAHFEHTIALTPDGPWILTAPPQPGESI